MRDLCCQFALWQSGQRTLWRCKHLGDRFGPTGAQCLTGTGTRRAFAFPFQIAASFKRDNLTTRTWPGSRSRRAASQSRQAGPQRASAPRDRTGCDEGTGQPAISALLQETPPMKRPLNCVTIAKPSNSYFACASSATTAATLSSIWFQPSS